MALLPIMAWAAPEEPGPGADAALSATYHVSGVAAGEGRAALEKAVAAGHASAVLDYLEQRLELTDPAAFRPLLQDAGRFVAAYTVREQRRLAGSQEVTLDVQLNESALRLAAARQVLDRCFPPPRVVVLGAVAPAGDERAADPAEWVPELLAQRLKEAGLRVVAEDPVVDRITPAEVCRLHGADAAEGGLLARKALADAAALIVADLTLHQQDIGNGLVECRAHIEGRVIDAAGRELAVHEVDASLLSVDPGEGLQQAGDEAAAQLADAVAVEVALAAGRRDAVPDRVVMTFEGLRTDGRLAALGRFLDQRPGVDELEVLHHDDTVTRLSLRCTGAVMDLVDALQARRWDGFQLEARWVVGREMVFAVKPAR
jgi:hypothetical protein